MQVVIILQETCSELLQAEHLHCNKADHPGWDAEYLQIFYIMACGQHVWI